MTKRIYGNWKMAQSLAEAKAFFAGFQFSARANVEVGIFPSYVHLTASVEFQKKNGSPWILGAQDCSTEEKGAFTAEVSANMIAEIGVTHVLIGHSERRERASETNATLSQKLSRAEAVGVTAVFCIGEKEAERDSGKVFSVLSSQIEAMKSVAKPLVVAYEPVWAIGTGRTPTLKEIEEVHTFLKAQLPKQTVGILYGGSAKPENAKEILSVSGVDGLLVGGASLKAESFLKIIQSCP